MTITRRSLETLIDLVEIKMSCMEVYDKDDTRELANLEHCLNELNGLAGRRAAEPEVVNFPKRRRGARRATAAASAAV
jgi:hypothetical protein